MILVTDENCVAPLSEYLGSSAVSHWLEHNAERRAGKWVLTEQIIKWIPVPQSLLRALGFLGDAPRALPGGWERLASEIGAHPEKTAQALATLHQESRTPEERARSLDIASVIFVRAARAKQQILKTQGKLLSIVTPQGKIRWRELIRILSPSEQVPVTLHPLVRLSGSLPPHLPIARIEKTKTPLPGMLFIAESGASTHLGSENSLIREMVSEQLEGLIHPTWSELASYLKLPRRLEIAQATAEDILRSHGEQTRKLGSVEDLLSACPLF